MKGVEPTLNRRQVEALLLVADRTAADRYTFVSNRTTDSTIPGPTAIKLALLGLVVIEEKFLIGVVAELTEAGATSARLLRQYVQRVA